MKATGNFENARNVDPTSGRPRHTESEGRCRNGREEACLDDGNALEAHSINQQLFSMICATSIGFTNLDLSACGQTIFNSTRRTGERHPPVTGDASAGGSKRVPSVSGASSPRSSSRRLDSDVRAS